MKKTAYLTFITIITVICIIAGSCYHIVGAHFDYLPNFEGDWNWTSKSWGPVVSEEMDLEDFNEIEIRTNVMDITVQTGDSYSISYNCNKKLTPEYEVSGQKLTVKQTADMSWNLGHNNSTCEMTITVPADQSVLEGVNVTSDVGDVYLKDLSIRTLSVSSDVGDITLKDLSADTLTASSDVGDTNIKNSSFGTADVTASIGDVLFRNTSFGQTLTVSSDVGNVDVQSMTDLDSYGLDLHTGIGRVSVGGHDQGMDHSRSGSSDARITINSSCGDIDIE